jgi:hypothetical protein
LLGTKCYVVVVVGTVLHQNSYHNYPGRIEGMGTETPFSTISTITIILPFRYLIFLKSIGSSMKGKEDNHRLIDKNGYRKSLNAGSRKGNPKPS